MDESLISIIMGHCEGERVEVPGGVDARWEREGCKWMQSHDDKHICTRDCRAGISKVGLVLILTLRLHKAAADNGIVCPCQEHLSSKAA